MTAKSIDHFLEMGHLHDALFDYKCQNALGQAIVFSIFFFCVESLLRDTNLHNKDCREIYSGSKMMPSCKCPIQRARLVSAESYSARLKTYRLNT